MVYCFDHGSMANRYRKVAAEYKGLSEATVDQFLRSYYLRVAEDYLVRSDGELRALKRESAAAASSLKGWPPKAL